ncbi:MAG: trigger factor, partial [Candidatus Binatia bacterium]
VEDLYPRLIDEQSIAPYGPGQLQEVKQLDPLQLEFVIPMAPEVTLGDYQDLRFDYELPVITDEDVDQTVENLRERQAVTETVERPSEVGDMLLISIQGREKGAEEGAEPLADLIRTPVVIESADADTDHEWPFPGFSHGLVGLSADEESSFSHSYGDDDEQDERLAGKEVEFKVVVHEVKSRELPEMTDEFVQSLGEYETVDDLRLDARKHLESSAHESYESDYQNRILDAIVASAQFHYPPQMVEDEVDALVDQFKNRVSNEGWDLDTYLKANDKDLETLREEFRETAENRIRRGLALMEIAEKESIKVSERDVQEDVQRTVNMVNTSFSPPEARKILTEDMLRGLVSGAMRDALTERTLARLKAIARGELEPPEEEGEKASPDEEPASPADETAEKPGAPEEVEPEPEPAIAVDTPSAGEEDEQAQETHPAEGEDE